MVKYVRHNTLAIWMMVRKQKSKQLAKEIGVSEVAFCAWRRNKSTPKDHHVEHLCRLLDITPSQFWYDPKKPFIITSPHARLRTQKTVQETA